MARNLTVIQRQDACEEIVQRLALGETLTAICDDKHMPSWVTVHRWLENDRAWSERVSRAREAGYWQIAERAFIEAQDCEDAVKGRLRLDATRWFLGKLSVAFSDNKTQRHEVDLQLSPEAQAWLGQDQKRA